MENGWDKHEEHVIRSLERLESGQAKLQCTVEKHIADENQEFIDIHEKLAFLKTRLTSLTWVFTVIAAALASAIVDLLTKAEAAK
jgi:hypothetical protein